MKSKIIIIALLVIGLMVFIWEWGFCRFYVRPDEMAIVITKTGTPLPQDQMLAKKGQQGPQEDVLGEGRHFRDPIFNDWKIMKVITIPPRKIGIVKCNVGARVSKDEFMVDPESGKQGIWNRVLGPGKYRMNPLGYEITVVDALSIPVGYAGVVTSLAGTQAPKGAFAKHGEQGVREEVLQPGLYHINPREYLVNVLEIGVNVVSLLGKEGGTVITKSLIDSDNAAMNALQMNAIQQQQRSREEYNRKK